MAISRPLSVLPLAALLISQAVANEPVLTIQMELSDGSRLIGIPDEGHVPVDLGFSKLTIPFENISAIELPQPSDVARVVLANDDVISGKLEVDSFSLNTIVGQLEVARSHVRSIQVRTLNKELELPVQNGLAVYLPFEGPLEEMLQNRIQDRSHGRGKGFKQAVTLGGSVCELDTKTTIQIQYHAKLCSESFTMAAWIFPKFVKGGYQCIAAKTNPSSWQGGYGLIRTPGDDNHITFFVNRFNRDTIRAKVPNRKWCHIAAVFSNGQLKLYVDGRLAGAQTLRGEAKTIDHVSSALVIGRDSSHDGWNGKLDDFLIYNRALSLEEVRLIFQGKNKN